MKYSSKILEDLVLALSSLPSVGKKSALRLALHIANDDYSKATKIAEALVRVQNDLKICKICYNYSDTDYCDICLDPSRSDFVICVVESARDVMAIEETQQFSGKYHVLGGVISPLDGIGPEDINIETLIERVQTEKLEELVMAISPTIDGDTTTFYISKCLADFDINISTIARGVSFGGELEYADELTLGRSILSRIPYDKV